MVECSLLDDEGCIAVVVDHGVVHHGGSGGACVITVCGVHEAC